MMRRPVAELSPEELNARHAAARIERLKHHRKGLCSNCTRKAEKGFSRCATCLAKVRASVARGRELRKLYGVCPCCGRAPATKVQAICEKCRKQAQEAAL